MPRLGIASRLGLIALVSLVVLGIAASALGGLDRSNTNAVTVRDSGSGGISLNRTIVCGSNSAPKAQCRRIIRATRHSSAERCLQIWGGRARTQITFRGRRWVITRANSCEIGRAKKIAALVD
jgi:hypothetical protein